MGVFLALHAGSAITWSTALRDGPGSTARRFGRVRDAALRPIVMGMIEKAVLPVGNKIRVSAGAPPVTSADEFMRRAPLMLVASGKPFEYPQTNWGDAVQLIGPCMFEPAMDTVPDWLEAIDRPIVLVTTSSQKQADAKLVVTAMTALADEPIHVVATLPAGLPSDVTLGPNATVCEFVPHGPVLDRAVCAVTHGGMGATQKALARGVPVCGAIWARPIRGRTAGGGGPLRHPPAREEADRGSAVG